MAGQETGASSDWGVASLQWEEDEGCASLGMGIQGRPMGGHHTWPRAEWELLSHGLDPFRVSLHPCKESQVPSLIPELNQGLNPRV